jgi:alanine racemase
MALTQANGRFARPNTFEIDLGAVARCVQQIRVRIGPDIYFIGTLKANAYGYGLIPAAKAVIAAGADALSLVSLDDAIALRRAGIQAPILVYAGTVPAKSIVTAFEKHDLIPTLHSDESLAAFARYASRPLDVAVKVDVGQERIGVPAEQAVAFVKTVAQHPKLRVRILNTHPSVTGKGRSADVLQWQYQRFVSVCDELEQAGIKIPFKVVASSKILRMTGRAMTLNAVDPGAALFSSLDPAQSNERHQPFRALKSRLIQVRNVFRSEFPEEAPFRLAPDMRIGVAPIGYSDGAHRLNCGEVLVRGKRVPILGSPALEYTRIDLTQVPAAAVGDDVVIIGGQEGNRIDPEEVVQKQAAARVSDLALEVRPTITRVYVDSSGEADANFRQTEEIRS